MKLIPAAERPKRSQSPCPTNRNQHRQTVLLVEFNSPSSHTTHISLTSGIRLMGIDLWAQKLSDSAR
jgi:hypothetical protein